MKSSIAAPPAAVSVSIACESRPQPDNAQAETLPIAITEILALTSTFVVDVRGRVWDVRAEHVCTGTGITLSTSSMRDLERRFTSGGERLFRSDSMHLTCTIDRGSPVGPAFFFSPAIDC